MADNHADMRNRTGRSPVRTFALEVKDSIEICAKYLPERGSVSRRKWCPILLCVADLPVFSWRDHFLIRSKYKPDASELQKRSFDFWLAEKRFEP